MKAITLWQPWATAMAMGVKRIETRSWFTRHRGDLLICAAKRSPQNWEREILPRSWEANTFPCLLAWHCASWTSTTAFP